MIPFSIKLSRDVIQSIHWRFGIREPQPLRQFGLTFDPGTGLWIDVDGDIADEDAVLCLFELTDSNYFVWLSAQNIAAGKKA